MGEEAAGSSPPAYGWKARGDRTLAEHRTPFIRPSLRTIIDCVPFVCRYFFFWVRHLRKRDALFIDTFRPLVLKRHFGVPCGALGTGSIGRDYRGGFCKFSLRPGMVEHNVDVVPANQFILTVRKRGATVYQKALCAAPVSSRDLSSWSFQFPAENLEYTGLYPRSWTVFQLPQFGLRLTCRQISPVIPGDYQESSLPTTVFVWSAENGSSEEVEIAITLTFRNGTGDTRWEAEGKCSSQPFPLTAEEDKELGGGRLAGISLSHSVDGMKCTYSLASLLKEGQKCSRTTFLPNGTGADLWNDLLRKGHLLEEHNTARELAVALSVRATLPPRAKETEMRFCLSWDMPKVHFVGSRRDYYRRYTRFYGREGDCGPSLCRHALLSCPDWEQRIEKWQAPVLRSPRLPSWYKSALFNELYFLTDGGSVWFEYEDDWRESEPSISDYSAALMRDVGRFGYLESWEYRMINTYDVHFYASFALAELFPRLEICLQSDFNDQTFREDCSRFKCFYSGHKGPIKAHARVPHDLGNPACDPWLWTNAYRMHNTGEWRDLNLKFVLLTYRDSKLIADPKERWEFLTQMFQSVEALLAVGLNEWDLDGDEMVENSGTCDQTYDAWRMKGTSAYCGSLWLGSLKAAGSMARELGKEERAVDYEARLGRARESYEKKLWTGSYYRFDEQSRHSDSIMADQLCGLWFLSAAELTPDTKVLPLERVRTALETVFRVNVLEFGRGRMGAVNGRRPNGKPDTVCIQSEEMWTGVTYAVAAFMIQQGLFKEGFQTAEGCYRSCFEELGLQYQTPEALYERHFYRAVGYMRPLAIYAIHWVLDRYYGLEKLPF